MSLIEKEGEKAEFLTIILNRYEYISTHNHAFRTNHRHFHNGIFFHTRA